MNILLVCTECNFNLVFSTTKKLTKEKKEELYECPCGAIMYGFSAPETMVNVIIGTAK